ncbi:MAG TPA: YegS/Rv2252/BmrU family lipid kinase [Cyclobacteriaceae bacterium]|jgi:YegS/Rv2252/BmrU family lipid kinase|nr:YegS/Rv2252/BmrU family lipid kinase [Cyclobacteriaceae bacterium]
MSKLKTALFIINKFSGGGYLPEVEGRIIEQCEKLNIESTIEFTQSPGHATELAQEAVKQKLDYAFAVGGDGTVNEVAKGLLGSSVAMGILPKGSGNGLARHLGLHMSFKKSLDIIPFHDEKMIDTLSVNGKLSVNVSGIGFDGHVAGLFANKAKRGLMGYAKLVIKEFMSFKSFEAKIGINGNSFQSKSFIIALANSSQFGNNARVAPQASVCDKLMDVCFIQKVPMLQAIGFAGKMFSGNLNRSRFVEIIKTNRITIDIDQSIAYHIDGEAMDATDKFIVELKPASLKILVPQNGQSKKYPI